MTHKNALNLILANVIGNRTDAQVAEHDGFQLFQVSFNQCNVDIEAKLIDDDPIGYEIRSCKVDHDKAW